MYIPKGVTTYRGPYRHYSEVDAQPLYHSLYTQHRAQEYGGHGLPVSQPRANDPWNIHMENRTTNCMYPTMLGLSGEWGDYHLRESPDTVFLRRAFAEYRKA
jgi:hypothetical protein